MQRIRLVELIEGEIAKLSLGGKEAWETIVDCKRGRASTAKRQPHREVGTQSYGPQL